MVRREGSSRSALGKRGRRTGSLVTDVEFVSNRRARLGGIGSAFCTYSSDKILRAHKKWYCPESFRTLDWWHCLVVRSPIRGASCRKTNNSRVGWKSMKAFEGFIPKG